MITFKLALSYINKQRGKTIALLASVALSVMLIFSLTVIRDSGTSYHCQQARDLHGDYTVFFEDIDKNSVETLKKQDEVEKLSDVKYFCDIVSTKNGVTLDLNSFNKDFIDSLNYKFLKGREPKNEGEIVIEEMALKQMGINDDPINKNIDFMLLNKYFDANKNPKIDNSNKTFKIVGIVQKTNEYYKSINAYRAQAFIYNGSHLPIKTISTYKGTINLKSENNKSNFIDKMKKELNISSKMLYENYEVNTAEMLKQMANFQPRNIINIIILVIVSIITTYNIFNIILADMINQIGMMRAIGIPKKKIKRMFKVSSCIYIIVGTIIGMAIGSILSYVGVRVVYGYSSRLYIRPLSLIFSFAVSTIAVFTSNFVAVRKAMKMSIIDSIQNSDKYKRKSKKNNTEIKRNNGSILMKFANRNIWRNKTRTLLTIIAISTVGVMFIFNYGILTTIDTNQDAVGGIIARSYGNVDLTLNGYEQNSECLFYKLDDSMIRKVKNNPGVKGVEPNFYNIDSYVSIEKNNVNSDYLDELKRIDSSYNKEYPLLVRGYNDKLLKNIDSFIGEGTNILNSESSKYKQVLLVNNCYSRVTNSFKHKVMNNVNVGDVLDVKLPVIKNGIENYETFKVQVAGIMKDTYIATQDGEPQFKGGHVILKEGDYKELTNQLDYNKLFVTVEKGKLDSVEKDLRKIVENHSFTEIGGKNKDNNIMSIYTDSEARLNVVYQCVIILMLSVNIIFIVRSNIIARVKELSVLRAIGMSTKNIKKIIMIESTLYGVISTIISATVATILYNRQITGINNISLESGYTKLLEHNIPFTYIIIFALITVSMCTISVYFSKDKIEKLSIVEGISES